ARRERSARVSDDHAAARLTWDSLGRRPRLRAGPGRVRGDDLGRREHPRQDVHAVAHDLRGDPTGRRFGRLPPARRLDTDRVRRPLVERARSAARAAHVVKLVLSNLRYSTPGFRLEVDATLAGQIVALFGPSGAGKTSLLDLIAGLRAPESGRIALDDAVLSDHAAARWVPARARGVGYVLQDQALFPHLSVRRNVLYGAHDGSATNGMFTLEHVADVLEIGAFLDRRPAALSGGEKQRVALARALLSQP